MEGFVRQPPPILFRAATLLGCVALLLGVAGIFYFGNRAPSWRETLPVDAATVLVRGIGDGDDVRVEAIWHDADASRHSEAGVRGEESGFWHFRNVPDGLPLRLRIYRGEEVLLHEQHAILSRGAGFEVVVRE
jgi:hypothetical protein